MRGQLKSGADSYRPQSTMAIAQVIFHRFFFVSSMTSFGIQVCFSAVIRSCQKAAVIIADMIGHINIITISLNKAKRDPHPASRLNKYLYASRSSNETPTLVPSRSTTTYRFCWSFVFAIPYGTEYKGKGKGDRARTRL